MSLLTTKGDIWSTAASQIIFSLSLTGGVMTAYGSNCPRTEPALLNSTVVAVANSTFSFIAGFAVFGSLGHLLCNFPKWEKFISREIGVMGQPL